MEVEWFDSFFVCSVLLPSLACAAQKFTHFRSELVVFLPIQLFFAPIANKVLLMACGNVGKNAASNLLSRPLFRSHRNIHCVRSLIGNFSLRLSPVCRQCYRSLGFQQLRRKWKIINIYFIWNARWFGGDNVWRSEQLPIAAPNSTRFTGNTVGEKWNKQKTHCAEIITTFLPFGKSFDAFAIFITLIPRITYSRTCEYRERNGLIAIINIVTWECSLKPISPSMQLFLCHRPLSLPLAFPFARIRRKTEVEMEMVDAKLINSVQCIHVIIYGEITEVVSIFLWTKNRFAKLFARRPFFRFSLNKFCESVAERGDGRIFRSRALNTYSILTQTHIGIISIDANAINVLPFYSILMNSWGKRRMPFPFTRKQWNARFSTYCISQFATHDTDRITKNLWNISRTNILSFN